MRFSVYVNKSTYHRGHGFDSRLAHAGNLTTLVARTSRAPEVLPRTDVHVRSKEVSDWRDPYDYSPGKETAEEQPDQLFLSVTYFC